MEHDVPVNPIKWSLSLCPESGPVSAFGGGYFDDSGVASMFKAPNAIWHKIMDP